MYDPCYAHIYRNETNQYVVEFPEDPLNHPYEPYVRPCTEETAPQGRPLPATPLNTYIQWHTAHTHTHTHTHTPGSEVDLTHPSQIRVELEPPSFEHSRTTQFGTLTLRAPSVRVSQAPLAILLNIDNSSSMDAPQADDHSKMEYIKHTLQNILTVLSEKIASHPGLQIYLCIDLFSHAVTNLFHLTPLPPTGTEAEAATAPAPALVRQGDFILINQASLELFEQEIRRIRPWGYTNLEASLKSAKEKLAHFRAGHPEFRVAHIQLTDGEATAGKRTPLELSVHIDTTYPNIFVGYGEDHDSRLLTTLGELAPRCEYRMVDTLAHTGLVYGELLYNLLYPYHDQPILITMPLGTAIYDWKTNTWGPNLMVPPLTGGMEKVYHVQSDYRMHPDRTCATLYYTNNVFTPFEVVHPLPPLRTVATEEGEIEEVLRDDLTKYLLRQLTLEAMYMARQYEEIEHTRPKPVYPPATPVPGHRGRRMPDPLPMVRQTNRPPVPLEEVLERLDQTATRLTRYQTEYFAGEPQDQEFVQTLLDDLTVTRRTVGTPRGFMYTAARQTTQGRQHIYTPGSATIGSVVTDRYDDLPEPEADHRHSPRYMNHTQTQSMSADLLDVMTQVQGWDHSPVTPARTPPRTPPPFPFPSMMTQQTIRDLYEQYTQDMTQGMSEDLAETFTQGLEVDMAVAWDHPTLDTAPDDDDSDSDTGSDLTPYRPRALTQEIDMDMDMDTDTPLDDSLDFHPLRLDDLVENPRSHTLPSVIHYDESHLFDDSEDFSTVFRYLSEDDEPDIALRGPDPPLDDQDEDEDRSDEYSSNDDDQVDDDPSLAYERWDFQR